MSNITIPQNVDQLAYYAVFAKTDKGATDKGAYNQCSKDYTNIKDAVEQQRQLINQHPTQIFKLYHILISQLYIPEES